MTKAKDEHLMSQKIRILFNDSHANVKPDTTHQGGPASFAIAFTQFFGKHHKDIEFTSLLFSNNEKKEEIYIRHTYNKRDIFEVVYPREFITDHYRSHLKKDKFIEKIIPLLKQVDLTFEKAQPDAVFLNGFNLSNWMIMEIAHRRGIPVCLRHAGIWKKELTVPHKAFSPQMKRVFISMEKETIKKVTRHVFLNESSKRAFLKAHSVRKLKKEMASLIPHHVETKQGIPVSFIPKDIYTIGVIARWDAVKNHDAILRLANFFKRNHLPHTINVVTKFPDTPASAFRQKYEKAVTIVAPMNKEKLKRFYLSQDIIFVPSRFETGPFILPEALMYGKTVLLSQNTGWAEEYRNQDLSDMLFNPRDSGEKIFSLVKKLEAKPSHYIQRFTRLQKKIIKEHTPQKIFEEYYKIFTKLTTQNNG